MKTGIEEIAVERQKQIDKHGFTGHHHAEHPEWYDQGQLIQAANHLISKHASTHRIWMPRNWNHKWWSNLCSRPYRERLVISAALIAAEIDRLNALSNDEITA